MLNYIIELGKTSLLLHDQLKHHMSSLAAQMEIYKLDQDVT